LTDREPLIGEIFIKDGEFVWATEETKTKNEKFMALTINKKITKTVDDKKDEKNKK